MSAYEGSKWQEQREDKLAASQTASGKTLVEAFKDPLKSLLPDKDYATPYYIMLGVVTYQLDKCREDQRADLQKLQNFMIKQIDEQWNTLRQR